MDRNKAHIKRMLEETEFIIANTKDIGRDAFLGNDLLQHGICMSLITIGECANHLSVEFTASYDEIPWIQVIGVRNLAAHGYWQLNMDQIWAAVVSDIPNLWSFLNSLIVKE